MITRDGMIPRMSTDLPNVTVQRLWDYLQESDGPRSFDIARADMNVQQYLGAFGEEADSLYGHSAFIINKTQLAIMAGTQIQTEKSPKEILSARESSRSGAPWMKTEALMTIKALEEQGHISFQDDVFAAPDSPEAAELVGEEYTAPATTPVDTQGFEFWRLDLEPDALAFDVSESFVERVKPLMQPWISDLGGTMMPVLKPDDFINLSDDLAGDIIANNNAILWDKSNGNRWLFENVNNNGIVGWQFFLYQWDEDECCDVVYNVHPRHIWLPPEATSIEDAQYAILRDPVSREQAIARYPELEEEIRKYMPKSDDGDVTGSLGSDLSSRYPVGAPWRNQPMMRPMIDIWTLWERGHKYPMRVADAMKMGLVKREDNGFVLADGKPTGPKEANWPKKRGVRQMQFVADELADDRECPYWDIPLGLNKNVLIPFRWVGQGDPQRLEWLDRLIMKLASCLFDIVRYSRSPQIIIPDDLWQALDGQRDTMASHPQRLMHVEATVYNKYREFFITGQGFYVKTMPFPEGGIELLQEMLKLHDVLSGNTAELQGRQSGDDMSGIAIQTLQSAARGIIGYKATQTEAMLVRLARLRIDAQLQFMPLRMWKAMNDKYPLEVLEAVKRRGKVADIDVKVEVTSGAGELRKMDQQQARDDFDNGRISHETMLEKLDEDVEQEQGRMAKQQAMQAQQAAAQQPAPKPQAA